MYCAEYLRQISTLCKQHNTLLILDEIATGFGRTGTLFAYQQANIEPDILVLGKALTGGYMTLAATLASTKVATGISADQHGVLMHGPTFMANPLACSVANASIDLLLESNWQKKVFAIEQQLKQELAPCANLDIVKEVRCKGAIGVVELHHPIDLHWMQPRFVELGVWVRPFNKLVYLMPPYIINQKELTQLTQAVYQVVDAFSDKLSA
jgi:adenosylmethionine-8-amino-7-oxononanoate aminotransferase